jgi:hypothetical protein
MRLVPLCLLSFVLVTALIRGLLPVPADGGLAAKLSAWEASRDTTEALFVGSSRVAHGIVPEVFDAVMNERGRPLRSFNLGVDAMGSFETDALVRRVLADPPENLAWLFVELDAWSPAKIGNDALWTEREIRWHDARLTLAALRSIRISEAMLPMKLQLARVHVEHFLMRTLNLGLARQALRRALLSATPPSATEPPPTAAELLTTRGFQPYPARDAGGVLFHGNPQAYLRAVEAVTRARSHARTLDFYNVEPLRGQAAFVEATGVRLVYFVTPTVRSMPYVDALEQGGELPALVAFHRPEKHPDLFELAHRHDDLDHLNEDGARAFTQELAEAFAELPVPGER